MLLAICAILCIATTHAQNAAQARLSKNLVGTWNLQDIEISLNEAEATAEDKEEFKNSQASLQSLKSTMIGNISFTFYEGGTYLSKTKSDGVQEEEKGAWSLEGDMLLLKSEADGGDEAVQAKIKDNALHLSIEEGPMIMMLKFTK